MKNYDSAIPEFDALINDDGHSYYQQSLWYRGLIHLQKGNIDATISTMNDIIRFEEEGKYAKLAENLLLDLEG